MESSVLSVSSGRYYARASHASNPEAAAHTPPVSTLANAVGNLNNRSTRQLPPGDRKVHADFVLWASIKSIGAWISENFCALINTGHLASTLLVVTKFEQALMNIPADQSGFKDWLRNCSSLGQRVDLMGFKADQALKKTFLNFFGKEIGLQSDWEPKKFENKKNEYRKAVEKIFEKRLVAAVDEYLLEIAKASFSPIRRDWMLKNISRLVSHAPEHITDLNGPVVKAFKNRLGALQMTRLKDPGFNEQMSKCQIALFRLVGKETKLRLEQEEKNKIDNSSCVKKQDLLKVQEFGKEVKKPESPTELSVAKKSSAQMSEILKKASSLAKETLSVLSSLNARSDEKTFERAAFCLIKLSFAISEELPFAEVKEEVSKQLGELSESRKLKLQALHSSVSAPNADLTGRSLKSSIMMKINCDALEKAAKHFEISEENREIDHVVKNVNRLLDVLIPPNLEGVAAPTALHTSSVGDGA